MLVAPVAAALLQLALSRSREFEADRTGAALVGDGYALAGALARIDRVARRVPMPVEPAQAPKYLVNPLTGGGGLDGAVLHPSTGRAAHRPAHRGSVRVSATAADGRPSSG